MKGAFQRKKLKYASKAGDQHRLLRFHDLNLLAIVTKQTSTIKYILWSSPTLIELQRLSSQSIYRIATNSFSYRNFAQQTPLVILMIDGCQWFLIDKAVRVIMCYKLVYISFFYYFFSRLILPLTSANRSKKLTLLSQLIKFQIL